MTERGYVRFDDALNTTLETPEDPLPENLLNAIETTASRAIVTDADGKLTASAVTATELGYLDGVTSAIQTQINGKASDSDVANKANKGANSDITSLTGLTTPLSVAQGGTGQDTLPELTASLAAFTGDSGAGGLKGLVPAPASGDAAAAKFLKADGTWAATPSADIAAAVHAATGKTTPVDADEIGIVDSAASNVLKKLTWANLKTTLLAVFGTNGIQARTSAGAFSARTITGTANEISVADGDGVSANPTISLPTVAKPYGKQAIPVPAGAMKARTTNGAAAGTVEMTTNKNMVVTLDFDASTQEFAQFSIAMPKSWNESTVTFVPHWSHASTTTNFGVVWSLAGVAVSNDDALDVAFGTAQTSTDTGGTTNDYYAGPESSAITIAGTPAANDLIMFQIARVPSDGSDTMAIDARLHGITLYITTDAGNDA